MTETLSHPFWNASNEELKRVADAETPKPQQGIWTLIAPDGTRYAATTPMRCLRDESNTRVPAEVALARIILATREEPT